MFLVIQEASFVFFVYRESGLYGSPIRDWDLEGQHDQVHKPA
jgi:hypothetical protein